jgi:putative CocE/NonD family hydrolase
MPIRILLLAAVFVAAPVRGAEPAEIPVERDVPVPVRDGTILRADVYRPAGPGPFPVLLIRTPYDKKGMKTAPYVAAGYIVVAQDARGRYASDGTFESFVRKETHDATDGYDTVEWAAKLPGSTGKVGTLGQSYNAFLQWRLAPLRPPSLVAMAAESIPARINDLEEPGTMRPGRRLKWWSTTMAPDMRRKAGLPGPHTVREALPAWDAGEGANLLRFLPWNKLPDRVYEGEAEAVRHWLAHPNDDPWKLDDGCKDIAVPNFDVVGWYDHCHGDLRLFNTMRKEGKTETARNGQRILIGPWPHSPRGGRTFGDIDFGPEAKVDVAALEIRWFDHWLKGQANGVDKDAPVRMFVMGVNEWRDAPTWPITGTTPTTFFLRGGQANTPGGNGSLEAAASNAGTDSYQYDPQDPVPSLFGTAMFPVAADQRPLAARRDILVYQTPPLKEAIEIIGHAQVELFAASTAPDTDFFARLIDVSPEGQALDVAAGMVRAQYRNGLGKPALLTPGETTKFTIRMCPTANRFLPGHRLRLDITSSDFPSYDRHHNTAADPNADAELRTATQTVHFGGMNASKIVLPVKPK